MNPLKMTAVALIVAGVLGLGYGSFSYTKQTHDIKMGPIEMSVQEKQTVNVPVWVGAGAILIGGLLLLLGGRKA
jgi:hypothetical protein